MRLRYVAVLGILAGTALPGAAEELEAPRVQLVVTGGSAIFRGGTPAGAFAHAFPFQPDTSSFKLGAALSVHLLKHLAVEGEIARARSKTLDEQETPENTFFTGGLLLPWPVAGGRFVPYLAAGGGKVRREVAEGSFLNSFESTFGVKSTDPVAYLGAGLGFRLTKLLGARADYRYTRIYPDDPDIRLYGLDRESYTAHRVSGGISLSF